MEVTLKMLNHLGACSGAIELVTPILPLTLYSDVDRNIEPAITLINHYTLKFTRPSCRCSGCKNQKYYRNLMDDLSWFLRQISSLQHANMNVIWDSLLSSTRNKDIDPLVVAQVLTWIAYGRSEESRLRR